MKMMRKNWKDRKGVSPVIATILMVAITVVLAAVLYVMVMGFGAPEDQTPTVSLGSRSMGNGVYEVYVISVSGGEIAHANVEAVLVSGNANMTATPTDEKTHTSIITDVGSSHENLQAGDKASLSVKKIDGDGTVTVMFKDKESGNSLGQITFNVVASST